MALGWLFGDIFVGHIHKVASLIGFLLLLYVGGSMILGAVKNEDEHAFRLAETEGKQKSAAAQSLLDAIAKESIRDFETQTIQSGAVYRSAVIMQVAFSVIGILVAIVIVSLVLRSITRNLNHIIGELTGSSTQVSSAASAIASSSSSLAESARDQAGQLQDTSSTLAQMAATTRQNAESAERSSQTTRATVGLVESGAGAVRAPVGLRVGGVDGFPWNQSVLTPKAARTAKNGSAQRTSSPKNSNACGSAWQMGKLKSRSRNVFKNTFIWWRTRTALS